MQFDPASVAEGATLAELGWVVLHFLWQGALLAALLGSASHALRRHSAGARYLAGCAALLLMAAAPVVTFAVLHTMRPRGDARLLLVSEPLTAALSPQWRTCLNNLLPWLASGWMAGAALLALRQLSAWIWLKRAVRRSTIPLRVQRLEALADRLVGRPVRFLESAIVHAPATLGVLRPIVLLPVSVIVGLSPRQLEAIVAHELAHIRRCDYLVNIAQAAIEAVLFFHPAVWWVSRRVRQEREHCCDDVAVEVAGDRAWYAFALERLERLRPMPAPALAANGSDLLVRIRRLLGERPDHLMGYGRGAGALWALTCGGIAMMLAVELLAAAVAPPVSPVSLLARVPLEQRAIVDPSSGMAENLRLGLPEK